MCTQQNQKWYSSHNKWYFSHLARGIRTTCCDRTRSGSPRCLRSARPRRLPTRRREVARRKMAVLGAARARSPSTGRASTTRSSRPRSSCRWPTCSVRALPTSPPRRLRSTRAGAAHNDEDIAAHGDAHAACRDAMGLTLGNYRPRPRVVPAAAAAAPTTPAPANQFDLDESDSD